jgi:GMP synthase (glutamine-hydrolysing)
MGRSIGSVTGLFVSCLITNPSGTAAERAIHVRFSFVDAYHPRLDGNPLAPHRRWMKTVVLITHDPAERDDDRVSAFLKAKDFKLLWSCPAEGEKIPAIGADISALIVYGGKYGVPEKETHAFLATEMRVIGEALKRDIPLLGICLGAQLIAHELGASVGPHPQGVHEYGYYPLSPTAAGRPFIPDSLMALQSHYHQFAIPKGAERLASGELYENQAFRYGGKAFGLQFHPEASRRSLERWIARRGQRNYAKGAHPPERQLADHARFDAELARWFEGFLEKWIAPALEKSKAA